MPGYEYIGEDGLTYVKADEELAAWQKAFPEAAAKALKNAARDWDE